MRLRSMLMSAAIGAITVSMAAPAHAFTGGIFAAIMGAGAVAAMPAMTMQGPQAGQQALGAQTTPARRPAVRVRFARDRSKRR
jgi:hypothetical protein